MSNIDKEIDEVKKTSLVSGISSELKSLFQREIHDNTYPPSKNVDEHSEHSEHSELLADSSLTLTEARFFSFFKNKVNVLIALVVVMLLLVCIVDLVKK